MTSRASRRRPWAGADTSAPHLRRIPPMRHFISLVLLATLLSLSASAAGPTPAQAQDRARAKEVIVAFAAEPRTLLPNTIVDWTTNDQVEHIYDRLVDRDPKDYKRSEERRVGKECR